MQPPALEQVGSGYAPGPITPEIATADMSQTSILNFSRQGDKGLTRTRLLIATKSIEDGLVGSYIPYDSTTALTAADINPQNGSSVVLAPVWQKFY